MALFTIAARYRRSLYGADKARLPRRIVTIMRKLLRSDDPAEFRRLGVPYWRQVRASERASGAFSLTHLVLTSGRRSISHD